MAQIAANWTFYTASVVKVLVLSIMFYFIKTVDCKCTQAYGYSRSASILNQSIILLICFPCGVIYLPIAIPKHVMCFVLLAGVEQVRDTHCTCQMLSVVTWQHSLCVRSSRQLCHPFRWCQRIVQDQAQDQRYLTNRWFKKMLSELRIGGTKDILPKEV
jgi:hypothetical protein